MTTKCQEKVSIKRHLLLPCSSHGSVVVVWNLTSKKLSFPILFFEPSKCLFSPPEPIMLGLSMPLMLPLNPPVGCHILWLPYTLTQILFKYVSTQELPTPCNNLDSFKNIVFVRHHKSGIGSEWLRKWKMNISLQMEDNQGK